MPTIYESTDQIIQSTAANETLNITRYVSVPFVWMFGAGSRLNNLGTLIESGVSMSGNNQTFYNYKSGLVFDANGADGGAVYVGVSPGPSGPQTGGKIHNEGEITSLNSYGIFFIDVTGGSLINAGLISAHTNAIEAYRSAISTIHNSGRIEGSMGIYLHDRAAQTTIINSGTIAASSGIRAEGGNSIALTNTGVITGVVSLSGTTTSNTVTNSGQIGSNLVFGSAADTYTGLGNGSAFRIYGEGGNDRLTGSAAADTLRGGTLNDTLSGGAGDDLLYGETGKDAMTGGTGIDRFFFEDVSYSTVAGAGRDIITDFVHGTDRINLFAMDANGSATGNGTFRFIAAEGGAFTAGARGQLRWDQLDAAGTANDVTYIYGDIDGDRTSDFAITLLGLRPLSGIDFVL